MIGWLVAGSFLRDRLDLPSFLQKDHGPGPDQGSPGAMAICHVVVAEKDEGESKRVS